MTYGYEAQGNSDRKIDAARRMSELGSTTSLPGALLVNVFPSCVFFVFYILCPSLSKYLSVRHIPEWLPWFSYKPLARIGYDLGQEVMNEPIQFVRESMVRGQLPIRVCSKGFSCHLQLNGTAKPSLAVENFVEAEKLSGSEREKQERAIAETLGSLYAGP